MQTFNDFQLEATKQFAHTLIVVDDEASSGPTPFTAPPVDVKRPSRMDIAKVVTPSAPVAPTETHPLRADLLVETSMSLGLICSVVKPKPNDSSPDRVAKASEKADILCVDWEMHRDNGKTAVEIISKVITEDERRGGRFRLIAIYTGVTDKRRILDQVLKSIPKQTCVRRQIAKTDNFIESSDGLRIVWLLKKGGTYPSKLSKFAVSEGELPERLQKEFALLSGGLLTNVAIATIASIRSATHHVISKFGKKMDGPYFQHRGMIPNPEDAEEYATSIILSELKNAIDSSSIANQFAGPDALDKVLTQMLPATIDLGTPAKQVERDVFKQLIIDGIAHAHKANGAAFNGMKEKFVTENFGQAFGPDDKSRSQDSLRFMALTCLAAAADASYSHYKPALSLGTIVRDASDRYYLCVQASCDSVRVKAAQPFLFAQLETVPDEEFQKEKTNRTIEFVVPLKAKKTEGAKFVCLKLSDKAPYAALRSITFPPTADEKVMAKNGKDGSFYFEASALPVGKRAEKHRLYTWVADVKRRRALRTVQYIGQEMGRIGFDEFETFRRKYS